MNSDSEAPSTEVDPACCPQCGASDAVLSLLTSMTSYFACRRCNRRWEVSVVTTPVTDDGDASASAVNERPAVPG